jgi:hypothetical protein
MCDILCTSTAEDLFLQEMELDWVCEDEIMMLHASVM